MARILVVGNVLQRDPRRKEELEARGHTLTTAGDGEKALAELRSNPPDLVLSAVLMSPMDAYDMLHVIRDDRALIQARVILLRDEEEGAIPGPRTPWHWSDAYFDDPAHWEKVPAFIDRILSS